MTEKTKELNYKTLIKKIAENGDLCVLGMKGTCKTTLLMHLARTIREDKQNRLIVFETFPKWIKEFDKIPFMVIKDSDVQEKENLPFLEENKSYIQWSKDFTISNAEDINEFLKTNKDCLFLIECEDMEKISAFMTFVIYQIYRKQYLRAKAGSLEAVNANYWFLCEEAYNLLDSTVLAKTTFSKLRKMQGEFRNLKMHLICVTLRLQSLSPKIRSTMSILCSRVSLDDYQLKVRNLLRNSEFRDIITELPKGEFIFPELDAKLKTEPFNQIGKPYEWKPKQTELIKQKPKEGLGMKYLTWLNNLVNHGNTETQTEQEETEDLEDSQGDALMTLNEKDILFPEDFPE